MLLEGQRGVLGTLRSGVRLAPRINTCVTGWIRSAHTRTEPVQVPPSVQVSVLDFAPQPRPTRPLSGLMRKAKTMVFTGPKGEIVVPLHHFVKVEWKEDKETSTRSVAFGIENEKIKVQRGVWGLTRALCANAVKGVEEGHETQLKLVGVGYRASVEKDPMPRKHPLQVELEKSRGHWYAAEQKTEELQRAERLVKASGEPQRLHLRLGYSHPVLLPVPFGIKATTPNPTTILLTSANKELLGQFAQEIRLYRKPEPYKGKGIFINGEQIRLKSPKKK
ncbi:54S ribosomal protein L6 mitochondrial [Malassezia yamatoensis]|uniref:54S ribosomal protein L6 mitochondrial n=1 Tax=Malassezia yamatoensis TaxID=253288 RepID=A0AAJ5YQ11_9BASI|nr:54S ribosomal protein L6 mitochondrial [Malassezia yamatoensis]